MRVPLSWLTDFAPIEGDPAVLAAALDDLGLVVEGIERVGEGLEGLVVARVDEIAAIPGADRIRRVVVDDGTSTTEVVCGATNFELGDLVVLAPVGSVLPGGMEIKKVTMKGVASNGMLCSGRELGLSDDHAGILVLEDVENEEGIEAVEGVTPGMTLTTALGIEPDVVFDIEVEANRPDAWSIAGVARDLAARLGVPFVIPDLPGPVEYPPELVPGPPVESLASLRVDDTELCPRFTVRVLTGVDVAESPRWLARRLTLAGMRPINNVVDASNYVMLELGQPSHPYDLDQLAGHGIVVRRAMPGETVTTLDGEVRTLGRPGPGLGDTGEDCLICDATGEPVGIGGVMGGASSEIGPETSRVLLETAYFVPMAIARTSKRLGVRTEASARFERGCDPEIIDTAAVRICRLIALTSGASTTLAAGVLDERHGVPEPLELTVRPARINALIGSEFDAATISALLTPLGFVVEPSSEGGGALRVIVPTFRPDVRPGEMGEADIAEEVARSFGYARLERRTPAWPQPGRLTTYQRDRREVRDVLCGLGASEAWTSTFLSELEQLDSGFDPPYVEVTNPLVEAERYLRSSMAPGLLRALRYNVERRQDEVRFFEVGSVFRRVPGVDASAGLAAVESAERISAVFAWQNDDAWVAVAAWRILAEALRLADWALWSTTHAGPEGRVLHDHRSAAVVSLVSEGGTEHPTHLGVLGELDPTFVESHGLLDAHGRPRRIGWLDLDLGVLLDRTRVPRRSEEARPVSRFPSSDVDLALVVEDAIPAGAVERTLRAAGGELLESVQLFDVYRGDSVPDGSRSLAFHLRFCALDRTLTDQEVGELRTACIEAVSARHHAVLR
ncbi:MAG: phenylalanine--tRNA ligase subunit beta [Acidimicrobiales bacterium]